MQEEENMRSNEERWSRERKAAQQLFHAEIETLKQQHAEHLNLLRQKWEEDKKEEETRREGRRKGGKGEGGKGGKYAEEYYKNEQSNFEMNFLERTEKG